jgi:hypothetical protein
MIEESEYGIPPALITVVRKMYKDCRVKFTIRKEERFIEYLNGVYQGHNASSVLFLFLMLAATDSFNNSFVPENKPTYHYFQQTKRKTNQATDPVQRKHHQSG